VVETLFFVSRRLFPTVSMSRYPNNIFIWLPESGDRDADDGQCQLMGPVAILVQLLLASVALLALFIKRQREHPPRPFQIWYNSATTTTSTSS